MASNNTIVISNWASGSTYNTYDVTQGFNIGGTSYYCPSLYFSTIDGNISNNPSGAFVYAVSSYSRANDLATVNITYTGVQPQFARGSLYSITGLPDPVMCASGMVLNVNQNGGNSIALQFVNPGPQTNLTNTTVGAVNAPEPSWTTGFFWTPSYTTPIEITQNVVTAQFEASYSQRMPQGIANNAIGWTLGFNDRSDKEAKGILAFVQNLAGVYSTPIMIPSYGLFNNPTIKYVLKSPKVNTKSYNISDVSVSAIQVYEF